MKLIKLATIGLVTAASSAFAAPLSTNVIESIKGKPALVFPNPKLSPQQAIVIEQNLDTGVYSIIDANGTRIPGRELGSAEIQKICYDCEGGPGYGPEDDLVFQDERLGHGLPAAPPYDVQTKIIDEHIELPDATIDRRIVKRRARQLFYRQPDLYGPGYHGAGPDLGYPGY